MIQISQGQQQIHRQHSIHWLTMFTCHQLVITIIINIHRAMDNFIIPMTTVWDNRRLLRLQPGRPVLGLRNRNIKFEKKGLEGFVCLFCFFCTNLSCFCFRFSLFFSLSLSCSFSFIWYAKNEIYILIKTSTCQSLWLVSIVQCSQVARFAYDVTLWQKR